MGYYSNVTIMCEEKAFELFMAASKRVSLAPNTIKSVKRTEVPNDYIIEWNSIKWYSYFVDVKEIKNVCSMLSEEEYDYQIGYAYKMIVVGEDNRTEEESNSRGCDELDLFANVVIDMPEDTEDITESIMYSNNPKFEMIIQFDNLPDSMCLDSGKSICRYTDGKDTVSIDVRGYVTVNFNGETFRHYSDMPDELQELFKNGNAYEDERVVINENNWYEVFFNYNEDYDVAEVEGYTPKGLESFCKECMELFRKK